MDAAASGAEAIDHKEYGRAVEQYSAAIASKPDAPRYYIQRSLAYARLAPRNLAGALADAETGLFLAHSRGSRALIGEAQLRRGVALFHLGRWADARKCFEWAQGKVKEQELGVWMAKVEGKLSSSRSSASGGGGGGEQEGGKEGGKEEREQPAGGVDEYPKLDMESIASTAAAAVTAARTTENKRPETQAPQDKSSAAPAPASAKPGAETNAASADYSTASASAPAPAPAPPAKPPAKITHDWYQTAEAVTVTILAKGVPKDKVVVDMQPRALSVSFPRPDGVTYDLTLDPLANEIHPQSSSSPSSSSSSYYKVMSTKIEIVLKKATPGQKWHSLEGPPLASSSSATGTAAADGSGATNAIASSSSSYATGLPPSTAPAYPTSSKSGPKNWDKLAADLSKKPATNKTKKKEKEKSDAQPSTSTSTEEATTNDDADADADNADLEDADADDDEDEGGDPVNAFFKRLYKDADPDTRRAMMKSYQESNGTALSTNWGEVSKGEVETNPPEGMEARKWGI